MHSRAFKKGRQLSRKRGRVQDAKDLVPTNNNVKNPNKRKVLIFQVTKKNGCCKEDPMNWHPHHLEAVV